ncbi:polysaccharide biosynthesis/export family protein [Ekhidna sp.]
MPKITRIATYVCLTFLSLSIYGQISLLDIGDVSSITPEQIQLIQSELTARGFSTSDFEVIARAQGLSEDQISQLTKLIEASNQSTTSTNFDDVPTITKDVDESDLNTNTDIETPVIYAEDSVKIFGMDLFSNSRSSFEPRLDVPTPSDYTLGPGDELLLDFWGATQQYFDLTVSDEGTVRPKGIRPIYVSGLTIKQAERKIISRMSQYYSGLNGNPPSINYELGLTRIRLVEVQVVGSVKNPGTYSLSSLSTAFTAVEAAGGPSKDGTFRKIRVIRENEAVSEIDLYGYLLEGKRNGDIRVQSGDVILIKDTDITVNIDGDIRRPARFEMLEDETIEDLISYAGGFSATALKGDIFVERYGENNLELLEVSKEQYSNFQLQNGDKIRVSKILSKFSNKISITGAVERPGDYQLVEGMKLTDLLQKATLRGDAALNAISLYRIKDDYSQEVLSVSENKELMLEPNDIVSVPSSYDLEGEAVVSILGEVHSPGIYPYFKNMTLQDLVLLAQGSTRFAGQLVEVLRLNENGVDFDLMNWNFSKDSKNEILPSDKVYIRVNDTRNLDAEVTLEGEVRYPGTYYISKKDETLKDVILRAGGPTEYADLQAAILIRKPLLSKRNLNRYEVNEEILKELRSKILAGSFSDREEVKSELLERVKTLEGKSRSDNTVDYQGQLIKYNSVLDLSYDPDEEITEDLKTQEPVIIDLYSILEGKDDKSNLILRPGDVISVPIKQETVKVVGEVVATLAIPYEGGKKAKYYIKKAGGFTEGANKKRSYVQLPNGERRRIKNFLGIGIYPKVSPGSTVVIIQKQPKNPANVQGIIASASAMASLILVIDRILN